MRTPADKLLIGAHMSASGGVHNALLAGQAIGATTIQLFTSNQRQWKHRPLPEEEIALWKEALVQTGLKKIMSHDSYLINLGSHDPLIIEKSRTAFKEELLRCHALEIDFLNFHPGAAVGATEEDCLDQIVKSIKGLAALAEKGPTRLLIETTAGQGSTVGYRFEHLAYLISELKERVPIGICIDTCHIFAAGYDIRTKKGWEEVLEAFDRLIGLKWLCAFHLNDSVKPLGSRVDRHAPLGAGEIGLECFKVMMTHPELREIPKYLETPDGPPLWEKEIEMLREFAS